MTLRFDHTYTIDMNQKFRNKLKKAGFKLYDRMTEHPGGVFCRFIMIPEYQKSGRQSLEFVSFSNKKESAKWSAGLSFGAKTSLDTFVKKIKGLKPKLVHKNYDWKENSTDRLPGWNFITFPKHKTKINMWLTEFEESKKRKRKSTKNLKHPNQVYRIVSLNADLDRRDVALYSKLLGRPKHNTFFLNCGTKILFNKAKVSKINTVVLATRNLSQVVRKFKWDELTAIDGLPAVRLVNPDPRMWDVVIVQGESLVAHKDFLNTANKAFKKHRNAIARLK